MNGIDNSCGEKCFIRKNDYNEEEKLTFPENTVYPPVEDSGISRGVLNLGIQKFHRVMTCNNMEFNDDIRISTRDGNFHRIQNLKTDILNRGVKDLKQKRIYNI